jgi:Rieske Fe-S protein
VKNYAEYLTPGEVASEGEVKRGEGAIMREGLSKVAVYRDPRGTVHKRSAACTHTGCLVHWNSFEKCWDCGCHGSHFSPVGDVLNAPAMTPLAEVKSAQKPLKRAASGRSLAAKRSGRLG